MPDDERKMDPVRIEHAEVRHSGFTVVDWSLGSTCNQACSYCPEYLHDGSRPWPDTIVATRFAKRALAHYRMQGRTLFFHFSGGEPTLYGGMPNLLRCIKENGGNSGLISNGRRSLSWWRENVSLLDAVVLTFHAEYVRPAHFKEVARMLVANVKTHVNVTMLPERFAECLEAAHTLTRECPGVSVTLKPLLVDFKENLYPYSPEQLGVLRSGIAYGVVAFPEKGARGKLRVISEDGATKTSTAAQLLALGETRWKGWTCSAGVESLAIDAGGSVLRAVCQAGGPIGHITDEEISLPTLPIRCPVALCTCLSDIMLSRNATGELSSRNAIG